jgi:cytochrome P450
MFAVQSPLATPSVVGSVLKVSISSQRPEPSSDFIDTFFASQDHDLHRKRRKPIEPYFSRNGVLKLEQLINERVEKLFHKFHELSGTGIVARLDYAFEAFTGDVMQHICIEKPESLLNSDDFSSEWYEPFRRILETY